MSARAILYDWLSRYATTTLTLDSDMLAGHFKKPTIWLVERNAEVSPGGRYTYSTLIVEVWGPRSKMRDVSDVADLISRDTHGVIFNNSKTDQAWFKVTKAPIEIEHQHKNAVGFGITVQAVTYGQ